MSKGRTVAAALATLLLAACEPAEEVRVQPLPPLERPSPEARAGLPEVAGVWRFAGWDLAPSDSASLQASLPGLGEIRLQTQRLDSLAGSYVGAGGSLPLVGEVRRDSVVSLVAGRGGGGYYLAGEVARDTLWIRLTSLLEPGTWPGGALAAFVRSDVASTFVRLHGTTPAPPVDSAALFAAAADSVARADSMALAAANPPADSAAPAVPRLPISPVRVPPTAFLSRPGRDAFGFGGRAAVPPPPTLAEPEMLGVPVERPDPEPRPAPPAPPPPRPQPEPDPEPEPVEPVAPPDTQPRPMPRLLGEPVPRDTASTRR